MSQAIAEQAVGSWSVNPDAPDRVVHEFTATTAEDGSWTNVSANTRGEVLLPVANELAVCAM